MLTGEYAERGKKSYKTVEGRKLLASVREAVRLLDQEMKTPASPERGKRIGAICTGLEMAADAYDLFGEKNRQRREERTNG